MPDTVLLMTEEKMEKAIEGLKNELARVSTGRANPQILNRVMVSYYGAPTPLNQVAQVGLLDPQTLQVTPYDKSALKDIEVGIMQSNLGFNPSNDGIVIRIHIPALTTERRKELAKQIKGDAEDAKVRIRNIRRDANDELKKLDLTEDDLKGYQADVQELTDKFTKKVDEVISQKEKDIMTV